MEPALSKSERETLKAIYRLSGPAGAGAPPLPYGSRTRRKLQPHLSEGMDAVPGDGPEPSSRAPWMARSVSPTTLKFGRPLATLGLPTVPTAQQSLAHLTASN